MAWHLALMAAPAVLQLGTSIFSFFKGRKMKKQAMAKIKQARGSAEGAVGSYDGSAPGNEHWALFAA